MPPALLALADLPLPVHLREALVARSGAFRLALVGGAVRDLFSHRLHRDPWLGVIDLDFVVEATGSCAEAEAPPAACRLGDSLLEEARRRGWRVGFCQVHAAYGTVELEIDDVLLDLATARREDYPAPGQNPRVRFASLEDDLARRDFSINAMALEIQPAGESLVLHDPHGGLRDLRQRRLNLLHSRSLEDDPTRILRAARYAARLQFRPSAECLRQWQDTLARWPWGDGRGQRELVGGIPPALGTRLRRELELLLGREPWALALGLLQSWGGMVLIDGALQADATWRRRLHWAGRFGLPLLPVLLAGAAEPQAVALRLQLPHRQQELLAQLARLRTAWLESGPAAAALLASADRWDPSDWCALLEQPGWGPEAVALALVLGGLPRRPLLRWWCRWRHLGSPLKASDLIKQGVPPGPELGLALQRLRRDRLAGERL